MSIMIPALQGHSEYLRCKESLCPSSTLYHGGGDGSGYGGGYRGPNSSSEYYLTQERRLSLNPKGPKDRNTLLVSV